MKTKRWIAALLCFLLIGNMIPTSAFAADNPGWNLEANGVLHITGAIPESGFGLTDTQKLQVKSAVAESGASISSGWFLFNGFENMTSADLSLINTTGVTDMSNMFSGCSSLTYLNLSSFDTSSVTVMNSMFSGCSSLTSLDVSGFSTNSVTSLGYMFSNCSSLTSIDLRQFETGNVTSMWGMFSNCSGLASLDLSSFDTSSVNDMGSMFSGCSSLTSLDVSGFTTDRLVYAEKMFRGCSALTALGITPDILHENADDIIAIRSPWYKDGSTDTYTTADELRAVTDTVTLLAMYTVNVQNDGNGTASANPAAAVKGDTVTLTATPNNGYHFKEWQSSDVTVNNNTFTMPEKNVTVNAEFEAHSFTNYVSDGNATCTEDGTKTAKCDYCGATDTIADTGSFSGHGETEIKDAKAATCTEDGYTGDTYCTVCHEKTASGEVIPAAHSWESDFTVDKEASCAEEGSKSVHCTKCDAKKDETAIKKTEHADADFNGKCDGCGTDLSVTYTVIAGADGEWTKGSKEGLLFTSDADFDKFDSVQVDGSTIATTNYSAEEGSTKITLTPAYLETLSIGSHSIKIVSKDGSASTNFTVKAAAQPPVPAKYTVSFNMNGHGTQVADQMVEDGSKATKPADPTASGWTFGGWYADATFSTKLDFNTAITSNTTAYAKWTKNSAAPADPASPQTGDTGDMFLWIALLLVSGGALVGTTVYRRKKKYNAK